MKTLELVPNENNLVETFVNDSIGRSTDVCAFVSMLQSVEDSCTISVEGRWGTGKTFFVKQCKMVLDVLNPHCSSVSKTYSHKIQTKITQLQKDSLKSAMPIATAYYDAWMHDDEDDPILSLMFEIAKGEYGTVCENKRSITEILAAVAGSITKRNIREIITSFEGKDLFEEQKNNASLDELIKEFFLSLLQERGDKIVVFIDELDRCSPTYAVKLLERVKHYFCCPDVVFVFSVNFGEIQNTIKNFYGTGFDACRYMDRFFDFRLEIPPIDVTRYMDQISISDRRGLRDRVCMQVAKETNMGMREISRFLQIAKMSAYRVTEGDLKNAQWSRDGGKSDLLGYNVIVPIAIGLRITKSDEYEDFISGKNHIWLERIMMADGIEFGMIDYFLSRDESFVEMSGKKVITKQQKIKEIYDVIFNTTFDIRTDHITVGGAIFVKGFKESLIKAINLVSKHTDYLN